MIKDKANIFKLEKLEEYEKDPFFDCTPGAEEFAKGLSASILTKETPFVLLLESKFGMGKTYFSTRFTQFLHNKRIDAIYFSAWENDYLMDPFLSFSKEIIKYFNKKYPTKTTGEKIGEFPIKVMIAVAKAISLNFTNIGVPVNISADKIFNEFKKKTDPFKNFKEKFAKLIKTLENEKLVLIVDELDRCRPDYAMKTLEIIKHFFDIEGLFVIVPTNKTSLNKCLISLYGISENKEENKDSESYFNKFFNHSEELYKPDYLKMVQEYISEEKLSRDKTIKCKLNSEHPFFPNGKKKEILTFELPSEIVKGSFSNIGDFFFGYFPAFKDQSFNSYDAIEKYLTNLKEGFEKGINFRDTNYHSTYYSDFDVIVQNIPPYIDKKLLQIEEYKSMWDSNDNDDEFKKYYDMIVETEYKIHTTA